MKLLHYTFLMPVALFSHLPNHFLILRFLTLVPRFQVCRIAEDRGILPLTLLLYLLLKLLYPRVNRPQYLLERFRVYRIETFVHLVDEAGEAVLVDEVALF